MIYKNKHNFPEYVVEWLKFDEYDHEENTYSATTLLTPPRIHALRKRYSEVLEVDVSDLIASRYGTAIHDSVERAKISNVIQEKRFRTLIENKIITGKFDMMKDMDKGTHTLVDIKSTSVWTYIFGSKDEDYIKQLSIYRYLARKNGYNVGLDAEIFMIFTDWSSKKAREDKTYPQTRIAIKKIILWKEDKTEQFIKEKVDELRRVELLSDDDLPECSEEDLWVAKDNTVRRCEYCPARPVCSQYQKLKKEKRIRE